MLLKRCFSTQYDKGIAFGSGPCKRCKECNAKACNYPEKTAPAMKHVGWMSSRLYEITAMKLRH